MANYFIDSTTGDDGDDGTTMDLAWATLEHALGTAAITAGDKLWIRRLHGETPSAVIQVQYDGTATAPIEVIGWPRASDATADGASWTNGSTTVDLVTTLSMATDQHVGRYVTGPDGETYLITKITDSNTFIIDREYAGDSVTLSNGAFTIQADEDYDTAQAIDDSGWTIDVATWTADADDLPEIDFSGTAFYLYHNADENYKYSNIHFTHGTSNYGYLRATSSRTLRFVGCLLEAVTSNYLMAPQTGLALFERCILVGSGSGGGQRLVFAQYGDLILIDCAIYNAGDYGLSVLATNVYMENVNIGVEDGNGDDDISVAYSGIIYGRDVKLGAAATDVTLSLCGTPTQCIFENYNKALGAHKIFNPSGTIVSTDVVAGSGDPYKRTGGADSVVEILYDESANNVKNPQGYATPIVLTHEFEATTDRRKYRYYVQAEGAVLASELWMEVEYINSYGDATTEYTIKKLTSDQAITQRVDASDWSQYLEVPNVNTAIASKVRVKIYCSYYHATNKIYIDPLPEVTT
jgi:hypothetical protein